MIPKPDKKQDKGFDFSSTFKQSVGTDAPVQDVPIKKTNGFDFSETFQQSLKKKDGTGDSTNGLPQPASQLPSQGDNDEASITQPEKITDISNIIGTNTGSINTPDGTTIDLKTKPNQFQEAQLQGVQDRILKKTATPLDIENISSLSGKSQDATKAYLTEGKLKGASIENVESVQNTRNKLAGFVVNFNNTYGTNYKPEDVLSSADKISNFLDIAKNTTLKSSKEIPLSNDISGNAKKLGLQIGMTDITDELSNQLIQKIVQEGKIAGADKDKIITAIAQKLNPKDYATSQKAIADKDLPSFNPLKSIGKLFDDNKEEDELLNYQKGIAELQYNKGLKQNAVNDISKGVLLNDQNLIKSGQQDLSQVDDNVIDKYPALQKQQIAKQVNDQIAKESGVVEGFDTESGHRLERILGASTQDRINAMQKLGLLDNPKTKDLALSMASNSEYFANNSILGGAAQSFLQPFAELGMSVGDITGFRNDKNIIADKIKDQIFQKDFTGNKGDDLQLKSDVRIARTIVNTTANLAGMLAVATTTEGIATEIGAGVKVAQRLGAYTSFGLPSFDASLKDSKNFIDSEPAQYLYATINSIANAEGGRLLDLGKITRIPGVSEDFAKIAHGLSDKTITETATKELLEGAKNKYVDFAVKYGTNVTKGAATMAYFNIANNVTKMAFGDPNTGLVDILPQAGHAFVDGVLGMSIMGGFGSVADMRNEKNTTYKGTIYNMAVNYDAAKDVFDMGLKNGIYTKPEYDHKVQILNTARVSKNSVDAAEQETEINLTQDQKAVYVANKTAQAVLKNKAEQEGLPEETKNKYLAQAEKLAEQSTQVLDGLKFTPTLEPLYDLYDAEKNYNQAQENLIPSDDKSEAELLKAKENYVNLYSDYLKNNSSPSIKEVKQPEIKQDIKEVSDTEILPTFEKVKSFIPEENLDETQNVISKINNAENINVNDLSKAEDNLYTALDKAPEAAHLIEPLILKIQNYPDEFKTKTEVSTATEKVPIEGAFAAKSKPIEIRPALEQSAGSKATITNADGSTATGTINIKSGQYVLDIPNGGVQRVIGEKAITDRDLHLPDNPIQFDNDGNVQSVTFQTHTGDLVTIHDPEKALDFAIQIQTDKVGTIPDAAFDKAYDEVKKEIKTEVPIKSISSPKIETNGSENDNQKNNSSQKANGESGTQENDVSGKKVGQDVNGKGVVTSDKTAPLNVDTENKDNKTPPGNTGSKEDSSNDGIGISKAEIFDKYGKSFEKTKIGWNDLTKNALNRIREDAESKNTSVDAEARFQVDKMAEEIKNNRLAVSEDRITAATLNLINTESHIDNLKDQKTNTPEERSALAIELDMALGERDLTLKVLDALGTKSGRNLGLFAGIFSKNDDGGITVTRRRIEGTLGMEIPETEIELDANARMSPWQKERARPYVKKIEEIKKEFDKSVAELKQKKDASTGTDKVKKEKSKASDSIRKFADKVRKSETLDKLGLGKSVAGDAKTSGFTLNVKEHLADALEFIADGIDKGEEISKLIGDAAKKFRGKNDENEFKSLINLTMGKMEPIEQSHIFNDKNNPQTFDVNQDQLDEALELQRRKTLGQLNQLSRQAEDANRKWYSKALDWRRSFLIGGIKTLGRVATSGVSKFIIDPLAKQTTGRISSLLPGLKTEKTSLSNAIEGVGSIVKFKNDASAKAYVNDKLRELNVASSDLDKSEEKLYNIGKKYGKDSDQYQQYELTDFRKAQQDFQKAELENAKASIYKWINGNGFQDAKELFKYGSTSFEQTMGGYGKTNVADLSKSDKALYYLEAMNRLHAVSKNSSARRALVETYNSRLENYQEQGIPLTASTRLRALDIAYGEFLSGKYQEKTQLADIVNQAKGAGERPKSSFVQKSLSTFLRVALPVAKIGINIVKTGVDMSTVGVEGVIRYMYEMNKGVKLNQEQGKEYKNVFDKLAEGAENIPEKDRIYINKVLSRGLFGLGLMLYAAHGVSNGNIQYGGQYDDEHKAKRKYKDTNGHWHELDYGQWAINGEPLSKFASSILNHLPEFLPIAMVVNSHNVYEYEHEYKGVSGRRKLKDKEDSFYEAFKSDVNEVSERLPFKNILEPAQLIKSLVSIPLASDISQYFDKDKNGNLIERKPSGFLQDIEMNTGFRKFVDVKPKK